MDTKVGLTPSEIITGYISELTDWRGSLLAHLRELIREAAPDITKEWKWNTLIHAAVALNASDKNK